ncbi:ABC transporter permease [Desmospora profundinema]|uniref:ABC-type transport system involved in multi-copper enzyme maturation permease subunit n=1 Tax=Desmospora profundinema TaxID=1571184 RepID=A0ABU1IQ30_9BACL|nr:ABC transporter permease subunit [Desmospora profundinema]MDR6226906.1 ABC-type transport system involved in multi-copper enzyme maturation permease subunit [Desmospora profundinema]
MNNLVVSEWERIWARKKTRWIAVLFPVLALSVAWFVSQFGIGFYTLDETTSLHTLNFPLFLMRELSLLLVFIFVPMLMVDSFNGETASGAYRLVLLRPQKRGSLLLAKWITQCGWILTLLLIAYGAGSVYGWLTLPAVNQTTFYFEGGDSYGVGEAFFYHAAFFGVLFLVLLTLMGLCTLIGVWSPNPVVAFISYIVVLVGSLYVSDQSVIYLFPAQETFRLLAHQAWEEILVWVGMPGVMLYALGWWSWRKKDWT